MIESTVTRGRGRPPSAKLFRKLDPAKVRLLKQQGLTKAQIAARFGVTPGAVYHVLRKIAEPV